VVYGKASTTTNTNVNLSALVATGGTNGFVINAQAGSDLTGTSVSAAGDVNGDGFADVIVSARNGASTNGRSYVVFGKANSNEVNLTAVGQTTGVGGFMITGAASGDYSGYSVSAAGDVNADGLADLIVSSPDTGYGFFVTDPAGGAYSGAWVYRDPAAVSLTVAQGDQVTLVATYAEYDSDGSGATLTELEVTDAALFSVSASGVALPSPTVGSLIDAARSGDPVAAGLIADAGRHLGTAVANLLNLVNPARVILGGRLTDAGAILLSALHAQVMTRALWTSVAGADVTIGQLGDEAVAIGAATAILRQSLREPAALLTPSLSTAHRGAAAATLSP
jgi:hypothetical protein